MSEMLCDKCLEKGIFSVLIPGKELNDLDNFHRIRNKILHRTIVGSSRFDHFSSKQFFFAESCTFCL